MALGPGDAAGAALVEAILSAFDKAQLSALVRYKGGLVLENEVDTAAPFRKVVQDLVVLLSQNDDVRSFVAIALAERPNNPKLKTFGAGIGVVAPPSPAPVAPGSTLPDFLAAAQRGLPANPALDAVAAQVGAPATAPPPALEAAVARRSKLIDFARFQARLAEIEARTCLIRTPSTLGTGFLVGSDRVLTNYHVVEGLVRGGYAADTVECTFDFNSATAQPTRVGLAGPPLASSPYSQSDVTGTGEPETDKLDFALLPLAAPIGAQPRGCFALDPLPRLLALGDFIFVCQHADGQALTLALGTITDFPGKAMRLRYDATTDHGSSGSPCFSPELDLIGLHHAADPALHPTYNQAVPIWLVARAIQQATGG